MTNDFEASVAAGEKWNAEASELSTAVCTIKRRMERDSDMLAVLTFGQSESANVAAFVRPGALELARAINGEAS
ncbi:hypothetical protein [Curtobacterium sp. USHLN213]|uniref:hypothetical protein n=1 Tax=Curtobacterium sp. USHLN213 TaxID=3081255 RepID=UPI00301712FC